MKYNFSKVIVKKTFDYEAIGKWYKLEGFDLVMCQLQAPMYGFVLNLVFGKYDEFERFMAHTHKDHVVEKGDTLACYTWEIDPTSQEKVKYILITEKGWTAKDYATICHELHHATHFMLDDIGIKYSKDSEEAFAYFQGYFMELVVRAMIELKRVEEQTQAKLNGIIHNKKKGNKRKEVAHNSKRRQKDRRTKR